MKACAAGAAATGGLGRLRAGLETAGGAAAATAARGGTTGDMAEDWGPGLLPVNLPATFRGVPLLFPVSRTQKAITPKEGNNSPRCPGDLGDASSSRSARKAIRVDSRRVGRGRRNALASE
jgi:hypothetical protein